MIRKTILLAVPPSKAFALFTLRISEWWPPERRHTGDPSSRIVLDAAGPFYEESTNGKRAELGQVLAYEPPDRLLLDWYPGTDREHPTRVEITFSSEGDGTRIRLQHGPTAASLELFPLRAPRYEASWGLVLESLAKAAMDNQ